MPTEAIDEIQNDAGQKVRRFDHILADHRRGALLREASLQLHELIGAVQSVEAGGEISVRLKVKPLGGHQIEIAGEVLTKLPRPKPPAAAFYVDQHGNATRHDPYQTSMFTTDEES